MIAKLPRSFVSDQDIISRLDVIAEYRNLGVRFVTTTPNEDGWVDCHGMGREDNNPSAGVHVASGYFNDFGDPNGLDTRHSLFEMAWMYGPFSDFSEAKRHFAEKVGIQLRGKRDPDKNLVIHDNSEEDDRVWRCTICLRKPGITVQALRHAGAKPGVYRGNFPVVALPVVGTTLDIEHPIGRVMLPIGNDLPVLNKDGSVKSREKMKTTGGSDGGLVIAPSDIEVLKDPERRKNIEAVWKVEGITDLLAFHAQLPANLVGKVIPFTNSDGCKANPVEAHLEHFNDLTVYVVGDADDPGEIGAKKWASKLATHARKTTHVRIAEDVTRKHGKDLRDCFTKEGWTYYDLVDQAEKFDPVDKRPKPFSNYTEIQIGDSVEIAPRELEDIAEELLKRTDGWPKRIGDILFVDQNREKEPIRLLKKPDSLFAWLKVHLKPVEWKDRKDGLVKRSELFDHLLATVESVGDISELPHEPDFPGIYYTKFCQSNYQPNGDGTLLKKLIDFFDPEDERDFYLILALFITPFSGMSAGSRPAFIVSSKDSQGAGKSKVPQKAAKLSGGNLDFNQTDKPEDIKKQFLSPSALRKRIAFIDNIKTPKFSWGALEGLITSTEISGHQMYVGHSTRPNLVTWCLTFNGVSLSRDMAQRSIIVHVKKPKYDAEWEPRVDQFIEENRHGLISEILTVLQNQKIEMSRPVTRWPIWESEVLSRCCPNEHFEGVQQLIVDRSSDADGDNDEYAEFESFVEDRLVDIGYDSKSMNVFIPNRIIRKWWQECHGSEKKPQTITADLKRIVEQKMQDGTTQLETYKTGKYRGYIFKKGENHGELDKKLEKEIQFEENRRRFS